MRQFVFKKEVSKNRRLLILGIILFSFFVLFGIFLLIYNKSDKFSFNIDDVLYAGNEFSYIVDIPNTKKDNLVYKFNTSDLSVAQFSYEQLKSKDEGNTLNIKGSGKIKIIIDAYDDEKIVNSFEKVIVVCKAFNDASFPISSYKIGVGNSASLNLDLGNEKECYDRLSYKSSDDGIVTVSSTGIVNGIRNGSATVFVSNGVSNISTLVSVVRKDENVPVNDVSVNVNEITVNVGKVASLVANVKPSNATNKAVLWESQNEDIAIVSSKGVVTGLKEGTTFVKVSTQDGNETEFVRVIVKKGVISSSMLKTLKISSSDFSLNVGKSKTLSYSVTPTGASVSGIKWTSSNVYVAKVSSDGKVTAIGKGVATISVSSSDGKVKDSVVVTVKKNATEEKNVRVTGVRVATTNYKLQIGEAVKLNPVVSPSNATNKSVNYTSSNSSVAKVSSSGEIVALSKGNCVITVTTVDGAKQIKVNIEVIKEKISLLSIKVQSLPNKVDYYVGDIFSKTGLKVISTYSDNSTRDVTSLCKISSPNMSVAGIKTITVSYDGKTTSFKINVNEKIVSIPKISSGVRGSYCNDCESTPGDSVILTTKNYKYTYNDFNKLTSSEKQLIYNDIKNPYIITAPHSVKQLREGSIKVRDTNTGEMCESIAKLTNSVCISRQSYDMTDPNYYSGTLFVSLAQTISNKKNAVLNMDLHGIAADKYEYGFAIGTKKGTVLSSAYKCIDKKLASFLYQNTGENISVNTYSSCDYGSSSYLIISDKTLQGGQVIGSNIAQNNIQLEMVPAYRPSGASMVAQFILNNF